MTSPIVRLLNFVQNTFRNWRHRGVRKYSVVWWRYRIEDYCEYSALQCMCAGVLVGNKTDLDTRRVVTQDEGKKLAQQHGMESFECSAVWMCTFLHAFNYIIPCMSAFMFPPNVTRFAHFFSVIMCLCIYVYVCIYICMNYDSTIWLLHFPVRRKTAWTLKGRSTTWHRCTTRVTRPIWPPCMPSSSGSAIYCCI